MNSRSTFCTRLGFATIFSFAIGGCTVDAPKDLPSNPATETYSPFLNVNISTMTQVPGQALYYRDSVVGTGVTIASLDSISVTYTGWLVNGATFDTNVGLSPFLFGLGRGQVITGWDEGIVGMKVGGSRKLVIGSALGYGANGTGQGGIPPNATLVFNVLLVSKH